MHLHITLSALCVCIYLSPINRGSLNNQSCLFLVGAAITRVQFMISLQMAPWFVCMCFRVFAAMARTSACARLIIIDLECLIHSGTPSRLRIIFPSETTSARLTMSATKLRQSKSFIVCCVHRNKSELHCKFYKYARMACAQWREAPPIRRWCRCCFCYCRHRKRMEFLILHAWHANTNSHYIFHNMWHTRARLHAAL